MAVSTIAVAFVKYAQTLNKCACLLHHTDSREQLILKARVVNLRDDDVILTSEMTGPVGIQAAACPGGWRNFAFYAEPKQ